MTVFDWSVVACYMLAMIALGYHLSKRQKNHEDYYVSGRKMPWWSLGISTMATQSSAISFISIPAFVAIKPNGGVQWLQWELAVPIAMIIITSTLVPMFRRLELVSVYEYLELRFDSRVRRFISGVFLLSRGLGGGVGLYAVSIILSASLDIPLVFTILLMGVTVTIYDTMGGMTAVVYADVIQMTILLTGLYLCIWFVVSELGGLDAVIASLPPERWHALDFAGETSVPFWPCLLGGIFLYSSYYGTDQTQVQRELSARSMKDAKLCLVFNGFARFPLVASYILLGIAAGAMYQHSPELRAAIPSDKLDYLIPKLLLLHVPEGLRAVIFSAILAAAMSSLESTMNSLSAASMRDFVERGRVFTHQKHLLYSKLATVFWGVVLVTFAILVGNISDTIIESINKIGSAFYGPILAAFTLGVLVPRISGNGVIAGVIAGVGLNLYLWVYQPGLYWAWWNLTGFVMAWTVAFIVSMMQPAGDMSVKKVYTLWGSGLLAEEKNWIGMYALLLAYFAGIFTLLYVISD